MKAVVYAVEGQPCPTQPCPLRHTHDHQQDKPKAILGKSGHISIAANGFGCTRRKCHPDCPSLPQNKPVHRGRKQHFAGCPPKSPKGMGTVERALAGVLATYQEAPRDTTDASAQHEVAEALNAVHCWQAFAGGGTSFRKSRNTEWGVSYKITKAPYAAWYARGMSEKDAKDTADRLNGEVIYTAQPVEGK